MTVGTHIHVCTHALMDGQPENTMPLAPCIGYAEA